VAADKDNVDVLVIGAGIAGASIAYELAAFLQVRLIERESQPGYHTTGRSAAVFSQTYGPPAIRALARASAAFFDTPPSGFADHPLLGERGAIMIARADQIPALDELESADGDRSPFRRLGPAQAVELLPLLRPDYVAAALIEPNAKDIDVHALHRGFLVGFSRRGGILRTDCQLQALERSGGYWEAETKEGSLRAPIVINAAGAWADEVAELAGAASIGLVPKRRTAMIVAAPAGVDPSPWPMAVDVEEKFYLKPDAGKLLISPADETPSPPCDAQPEEFDIALGIDRIQTAFDLDVPRVESSWAGLRSFVADKTPVVGFDSLQPGFFWLAGQGGYGIQSAPALARSAAALVRGQPIPADVVDHGLDAAALSPQRLRRAL
jgi:D-arginine dehydrogenase